MRTQNLSLIILIRLSSQMACINPRREWHIPKNRHLCNHVTPTIVDNTSCVIIINLRFEATYPTSISWPAALVIFYSGTKL